MMLLLSNLIIMQFQDIGRKIFRPEKNYRKIMMGWKDEYRLLMENLLENHMCKTSSRRENSIKEISGMQTVTYEIY
jgi:hypothetical protein